MSTSGNLLKGKTASLIANTLVFLFLSRSFLIFWPAIILVAILAIGIFSAFDTKGTVLLALGFTSRTNISSFCIANWIFISPITPRLRAKIFVWSFIFSIIFLLKEKGGMQHAESPECIPASSMCCIIPATKTSLPSHIASTSSSIAPSKNLSIRTGLFPETFTASLIYFSNWLLSWIISIALPPKT